jgi:hypothetical protein
MAGSWGLLKLFVSAILKEVGYLCLLLISLVCFYTKFIIYEKITT